MHGPCLKVRLNKVTCIKTPTQKKKKKAETSLFTLKWVPTTNNYRKLIFCNKLLTCAFGLVSEL